MAAAKIIPACLARRRHTDHALSREEENSMSIRGQDRALAAVRESQNFAAFIANFSDTSFVTIPETDFRSSGSHLNISINTSGRKDHRNCHGMNSPMVKLSLIRH